jgi:hypothetical protein
MKETEPKQTKKYLNNELGHLVVMKLNNVTSKCVNVPSEDIQLITN